MTNHKNICLELQKNVPFLLLLKLSSMSTNVEQADNANYHVFLTNIENHVMLKKSSSFSFKNVS